MFAGKISDPARNQVQVRWSQIYLSVCFGSNAVQQPMSAKCQKRTSDAAWILLRSLQKNPGFVCRGVWHLKPPRGRQFEYAPAKLSSFCLELRRLFHIFLGKEPNNHQSFRWISFRFKQCLKSIDVGHSESGH